METLGYVALVLLLILHSNIPPGSLSASAFTPLPSPYFPSKIVCPEGLFVFGSSIVDTGNAITSIPFYQDPENLPYGISFFGRPARRYSDGRVLVDYFSQAFKFPLLTPYLQSIAPDFRRGANFGYAGATILSSTIDQVVFYFGFQQGQFLRLKQNALQVNQEAPELGGLTSTFAELLPTQETFDNGLYIIRFGLNNDILPLLLSGSLSFDDAKSVYVPALVSNIVAGIQNLYNEGARQFLVFYINSVGCAPRVTSVYANNSSVARDEFGCLTAYSDLAATYNTQLGTAVNNLRENLTDSTILLFDTYSAQREVFTFPENFGFSRKDLVKACCGVGGEFNFDVSRPCGRMYVENNVTKKVEACANPNQFVNWDGIHDTEALARVYAEFALKGQYLDPPIDLSNQCNLDFSKFTGSNYTDSYPKSILLI